MGVLRKKTPWEQEFRAVWQREQRFLGQYRERPERLAETKLGELVPQSLLKTLHGAFEKAFAVVFEKGTGLIQKAGRTGERKQAYQVNAYAADLREDRKTLRAFSKAANRAGWGNVLASGTAGVGMGLFGVMLPDVPLFTAMLLKCVYETAESFGYSCESGEERMYALRIIEAALSDGEDLCERNRKLDVYAQTGAWEDDTGLENQVKATARRLSKAVLVSKAVQNIPVAGAAGGFGDAVCLDRARRYAAIKYYKRFLISRRRPPV